MSERVEQMFSQLRRGPWHVDPTSVPQEGFGGNGNVESQGWISDGAITADTIQANAVTAGKIAADAVTANEIAANTITANEIAANTITANEIAANTITAAEIAANTITANEIAANTITAAEIAADSITTSELAADAVITENILASNVTSSRIELTISGKNFGANAGSTASPGIYFDADSSAGLTRAVLGIHTVPTIVQGGFTSALFVGATTVGINGNLNPTSDNAWTVGDSSLRWSEVWAVDGTINTSDERLKRDIADSPLGLDFIRSLRPRVYRWRDTTDTQARESVQVVDGEALARAVAPREKAIRKIREGQMRGTIGDADGNGAVERHRATLAEIRDRYLAPLREAQQKRRPGRRLHYGLIAQEVKAALDAAGVDSDDAAFWKQSPDGTQSLSYTELIAPLLRSVQELAERVEELEHGRT